MLFRCRAISPGQDRPPPFSPCCARTAAPAGLARVLATACPGVVPFGARPDTSSSYRRSFLNAARIARAIVIVVDVGDGRRMRESRGSTISGGLQWAVDRASSADSFRKSAGRTRRRRRRLRPSRDRPPSRPQSQRYNKSRWPCGPPVRLSTRPKMPYSDQRYSQLCLLTFRAPSKAAGKSS